MKIKKIIQRIFCKHENKRCLTNIHGDYINHVSSGRRIYRSIWGCPDCGRIIMSEYLDDNCEYVNWQKK